MSFLNRLGLSVPLVQAPMAGVSTPTLAAAVSNAGALGSIGVGAIDAAGARMMIAELRARTDRAFNVNLFVHATGTLGPGVDPPAAAERGGLRDGASVRQKHRGNRPTHSDWQPWSQPREPRCLGVASIFLG